MVISLPKFIINTTYHSADTTSQQFIKDNLLVSTFLKHNLVEAQAYMKSCADNLHSESHVNIGHWVYL